MTTENLFEMATRSKLRFPSTKGELSVEDLWDLSDKDLDVVYKNLKLNLQKKVCWMMQMLIQS